MSYSALALRDQAIARYQASDKAGAIVLMQQALERAPEHPLVALDLGKMLVDAGRFAEAQAPLNQALQRQPNGEVVLFLARCWRGLGRYEQAQTLLQQALDQADDFELLTEAGLLSHLRQKPEQTLHFCQRACALKPNNAHSQNNLAAAWLGLEHYLEALASAQEAARLAPDMAGAWFHQGRAQMGLKQWQPAAAALEQALERNPSYLKALRSLAEVLEHQGLDPVARLAQLPDSAMRLLVQGELLKRQGRSSEAIDCFRRVLAADQGEVEAFVALGSTLFQHAQADEAVAVLEHAQKLFPLNTLVQMHLAAIAEMEARSSDALRHFQAVLALEPDNLGALSGLSHHLWHTCQWQQARAISPRLLTDQALSSGQLAPFGVVTLPTSTAAMQHQAAMSFSTKNFGHIRPWPRHQAVASGPLRVGYVSADFYNHATSYLMAGLFECHDRSQVEAYAYGLRPKRDAMTERIERAVEGRFVDLSAHSAVAAAQRIQLDGIDLLIDLKGYTSGARPDIFALHPAPVQIGWLAYPGTMGASFLDYFISNHFLSPPGAERWFSEKLLYIEGSYQFNDHSRPRPSPPSRQQCQLPEQGLVLCAFNAPYKITPEVFALWMRLLASHSSACLWLQTEHALSQSQLKAHAQAAGIDPNRLVFAPKLPLEQHLARYHLADLFLDTFPVNAHTTASDALWMGVPLITVAGESFVSRVAADLLRSHGCAEHIATDLADYHAKADALCAQPQLLAQRKAQMQRLVAASELFNGPLFARRIEQLYADLAQRHQLRAPVLSKPSNPTTVDQSHPALAHARAWLGKR